jgi:hypothetical protein
MGHAMSTVKGFDQQDVGWTKFSGRRHRPSAKTVNRIIAIVYR